LWSEQIFKISSIEFQAVRRFLCNEVLQKIVSGVESHEELKIEPRDEIDNESNMEFEVKNYANFEVQSIKKLEVEAHDDCKFEQEDQGSPHQDN
jgi:hypothetical protein